MLYRHVARHQEVDPTMAAGRESMCGALEAAHLFDLSPEDTEQVIPEDLAFGNLARVVGVLACKFGSPLAKGALRQLNVVRV